MRTAKDVKELLARWPAGGLRHSTEDGGKFDPMKSEAARWITSQPEFLNWAFQTWKERGFLRYEGERWHAVDLSGPDEQNAAIRKRKNKGGADDVRAVCPPELALWLLNRCEGRASAWSVWKGICEEEVGAKKAWGKWSFWWAVVVPLKKAGKIERTDGGEWAALERVDLRPVVQSPMAARLLSLLPLGESKGARAMPEIMTALGVKDWESDEQEDLKCEIRDVRRDLEQSGRIAYSDKLDGYYRVAPSSQPAPEVVEV